jgi:uncharacterized protein (TIRG00374 family)
MKGLKNFKMVYVLLIKLSLTLLAFYIISKRITFDPRTYFNQSNSAYFLLALFLVLPVLLLQAVRWRRILKIFSTRASFWASLVAIWFGHLMNNLMPTASGGDLLRSYTLRYAGKDKGHGKWRWLGAFFSEKYIAATSALLIACGALFTSISKQLPVELMILIILLSLGLVITPILLAKVGMRFTSPWIKKLINPFQEMTIILTKTFMDKNGRYAFLVSVVINIGMCLIFYVIARALSIQISFSQCLFVVPVFTLLASLPISYAGWGVRELSCVGLLSFFGVPTESAVIVSVMYGLVFLVSSLPGIVFAYPFLSSMYHLRKNVAMAQ